MPQSFDSEVDVRDLLNRVEALEEELKTVQYAEPKQELLRLVFADGTDWNPGSGRGYYYWDGSWVKL